MPASTVTDNVALPVAQTVDENPVAALSEPELTFQLGGDGRRVSAVLRDFVETQHWQLAWEIERDFPIEYPATFTGDFLGIIEQVVLSLQNSDAPIRVKVYEANRVLRVVHATQ
ncbi:TcpQ domain-containing protein [Pandoraea pneumonica]|uniref:TcpQ domain-containing protein n=1 Tax=Pandoraea pneumonica TaxID=2508299 RepID=UPI003CF5F28E